MAVCWSASTPNPFSRKFVRQFLREGVIVVNLDHVAWITPTQAMEIARRIGLRLTARSSQGVFSWATALEAADLGAGRRNIRFRPRLRVRATW